MERSVRSSQTNGRRSRKEDCDQSAKSDKQPYILPEWITPLIKQSSETDDILYGVILPEQSELEKMGERNQRVLRLDAPVTNAIFYRRDRWRPASKSSSTTNCVMQGFVPVDRSQMNNTPESANGNNNNEATEPIVIVSIHLDAKSEEKRCQQLQRCLLKSAKLSDNFVPPAVIAGDYNCELFRGSCVYNFLDVASEDSEDESGDCQSNRYCGKANAPEIQSECARALRLPTNSTPSSDQMKSWTGLCDDVSNFVSDNCFVLNRVDTGTTRVAYNHDCELSDEGLVDTLPESKEEES
jgi:endonuclease/exonuclease/phosphatase family metal-dependent hydrolase